MLALGDIHGNFNYLKFLTGSIGAGQKVIQVGDFGLGFTSKENDLKNMHWLNEHLKAHQCFLYAIRGNHDDPHFWSGKYADKWSNLLLIPDYTVAVIENQRVLFIGGAISIDRQIRREGRDYWKDEGFKYDEELLTSVLKEAGGVDIVITHSAPDFCYPPFGGDLVAHYTMYDTELKTDLLVERNELTRAFRVIQHFGKPDKYIYAHFHADKTEYIEDTKFILLGVNEWIKI